MSADTISGFRLSPQQQHAWELLTAGLCRPWTRCTVQILGGLDSLELRSALERVIDQHEILRTSYVKHAEMKFPVQVVHAESGIAWQESGRDDAPCDLGNLESVRHSPGLFEQREELVRAHLRRIGPDEHHLTVVLPNLSIDRGSIVNLVRVLAAEYGIDGSADASEHDAPLQYTQFSEWQHELFEDEDGAEATQFWARQEQLTREDERARVTLGLSDPKSVASRWQTILPASLTDRLFAQLSELDVQPDDYLFACWTVLQWKLSGETPIVTADIAGCREHEMLEPVMGFLAKALPIVSSFPTGVTFHELLRDVVRCRDTARQNQEYFRPTDWGAPTESLTAFEFHEPSEPLRCGPVTFCLLDAEQDVQPAAVSLACVQMGDQLKLNWRGGGEFSESDLKRLSGNFLTLIENVVDGPDKPLDDIEVLSAADSAQILDDFNRDDDSVSPMRDGVDGRPRMFEELVLEQAALRPDRVAVDFQGHQVTYGELQNRAMCLADQLRGLGVGPDVVVGICLERSVEMIIAALATMTSGGAYLPIDPSSPKRRIEMMLRDSKARVLVTKEGLRETLPESVGDVLYLDADTPTQQCVANQLIRNNADAENLAYVIYTSGSTGQPKGVMVRRGALPALLSALDARVSLKRDRGERRVGWNAPFTFDASVKQLARLAVGETLVIFPEEVRPDGRAILEFVRTMEIDVFDCTPVQLRLMLQSRPDRIEGDFAVLIGGEAIGEADWKRMLAAQEQSEARFFNVYGPTECTVDATAWQVDSATPTIGRTLNGVRAFVLEDANRLSPIGKPGELHLAGWGVARGYLNRPELTAARFVPDPFASTPGQRMYRTGDLATFDPAGRIRFIGRTDRQVKIRGYRVELGEVEHVLRQHTALRDVAVLVREDQPGDPRLVAYITSTSSAPINEAEIRAYLRQEVAEYMVPAAFVVLDQLPITRNGKVDHAALPAPEHHRPHQTVRFVAPEGETEDAIARIWQTVLNVDQVGVEDNFFDLGGHSLLLVQVHVRLREEFESNISLIDMFRNPTVRALSKFLNSTKQAADDTSAYDRAQNRAARRRRSRRGRTTAIERSAE